MKTAPSMNQIPLFDGLPSHNGDVKALRKVKELAFNTLVPERFLLVQTDRDIEQCVATIQANGACTVDTETTGVKWKDRPVAISFTAKDNGAYKSYMVPTDMLFAKRNFTAPEVREAFEPIFADQAIKKINHNIKFDMHKLRQGYGIEDFQNVFHDTLLAQWILNENEDHDLESVCQRYLSFSAWKIKNDGKFGIWPINVAVTYACSDTENAYRLYEFQCEHLVRLPRLSNLFYEVEMPCLKINYEMERRGIAWDSEYAANVMRPEIERELKQAETECRKYLGNINLGSHEQVAKVLYDGLGLPRVDAEHPYSVAKKVLVRLRGMHPVIDPLRRYRRYSKIKEGFSDTLPSFVEAGRIHPTAATIGTVTGREAYSHPNLQQIPKQSVGPVIRRAFVPSPGHVLVTMDYSQIELRFAAHFSQDETLLDVYRSGKDVHMMTTSRVFKYAYEELEADKHRAQENAEYIAARVKAKNVNFGALFGVGDESITDIVNDQVKRVEDRVTRQEMRAIIDGFFETYVGLATYQARQERKARKLGYVETILGRKRRLPFITSTNWTKRSHAERQAGNAPIQGSAADLFKYSLVKLDRFIREQRWPYHMILAVHDELILEVPLEWLKHNRATLNVLSQIMATAIELTVPIEVSVETLTRWGDRMNEDSFDLDDEEALIAV